MVQHRLCLRLEGAKITLPVKAKAERRVEDGAGVERKLGSVESLVTLLAVRAIGPYIVARRARPRPVARQARICKQVFSQSELQRVCGGRRRYRRNRLLFGGSLWTEGL